MERTLLWIMGGPGAGKGTQCGLIAADYSFIHLSTGDLLRQEVLAGSERWMRLHELIVQGQLAPDDEVVALLLEAIEKHPEAKGFLIDGFPANMEQAKICEEKLGKPTKIIVLDVYDDVMTKRLEGGENFNDQHETIQKRIATYTSNTTEVIAAYSTAVKVKADRPPEEVYADIKLIMDR